jgi:hypothetical protein
VNNGSTLNGTGQDTLRGSLGETERLMLPMINTGSSLNNLTSLLNTKTLSGSNIGTIKLTGKQGFSLRSTLDALDLIPEYDEFNKIKAVQTENFIHKQTRAFSKDNLRYDSSGRIGYSLGSSIDMAKHSAHILKNTQWGSTGPDKPQTFLSSIIHPHKVTRKEIIKEVGKIKKFKN